MQNNMTAFRLGDYVYLKHDPNQHKRMVTGILVTLSSIQYLLSCGAEETYHSEDEISIDLDTLLSLEIKNN